MTNHSGNFPRALGFSLVELMVAMVAGLIVSGAVLAFFFASMKNNGEYIQSTRLTQELRNTLDLVTRGLQRAGYDQDSLGYMATGTTSPFLKVKIDTANECVIYAYDRADHGVSGCTLVNGGRGVLNVCNGEVMGVRRRSGITNVDGKTVGVVEYAQSTTAAGKPDCTAAGPTDYATAFPPSCNSTTGWCALSDPTSLDITALTFTDGSTLVGTAPTQVRLRDIGVGMTGKMSGATVNYTRTVNASVRVRSDCYNTTIANCASTVSP